METDIIELVVTISVAICATISIIRNVQLEQRNETLSERSEFTEELETIHNMLNALMVDNKSNLALRAYVIKEYGIQLSDNDILTLMIEWNKQLETSAEFAKFVKQYLEDKKWLYR